MFSQQSTIAAIATGHAPGGIGVIRISGPRALNVASRIIADFPSDPIPRRASLCRIVDGANQTLDEGLFIYFRAPHSYTADDVVEIQMHGAPRLLQLTLQRILEADDVRLAEPGEFTRRAFLAGRLDLVKAEAVADLISAESEAEVRSAAAQLSGQLRERLDQLRRPLVELQADIEGVLEFPDEAADADAEVPERIDRLVLALQSLVADGHRGVLIRRGAKIVLYGPVNAGKSTLFNRLIGADRAIVDAEPGTTRDTLEARIELDGLAVTLVDTAGLRDDAERIESLGIARTLEGLRGADVAILLLPSTFSPEQRSQWLGLAGAVRVIEIFGKSDLRSTWNSLDETFLSVSGETGQGVDALRTRLVSETVGSTGATAITSERHLNALKRSLQSLERAQIASRHASLEIAGGEITQSLIALAEITGEDVSNERLDAIFSRFCIGK